VQNVDPRDQRIAELEAQVAYLTRELGKALARIAELEAKLAQNSTNSSKPPSSDPPGVSRRPSPPSGRKPGGQPGHKGHRRAMLPVGEVNEVVVVKPTACDRCGGALVGRADAPEADRHQQTEIPPITPHTTEYQLHSGFCAACDCWTCASLPAGVPNSAFGVRLTALVALLSGQYRLTKRLVQDLLSNVLGTEMSLGSVSKLEQQISAAVAAPVDEARAFVREQPIVQQDETGWREALRKAWLWVAVAGAVTVFLISRSRGAAVSKEMLGESFAGHLVTDRWSAYTWVAVGRRQLCWGHLERDFQGFVDRDDAGSSIGRALLRQSQKMFKWWHRVRDGTLQRRTFERRMQRVEKKVGQLLRRAVVCSGAKKTAGMAKEILKLEPALWTFVHVEGIEPTNNTSERRIRPAVLWRKGSFGTHSPEGSRFVERMLTVTATLRCQRRNVLEYLTAAYTAHLRDLAAPSLLPQLQLSRAAA
jgi:transposase